MRYRYEVVNAPGYSGHEETLHATLDDAIRTASGSYQCGEVWVVDRAERYDMTGGHPVVWTLESGRVPRSRPSSWECEHRRKHLNKEILEKALVEMQANDEFTMREIANDIVGESCGTPGCIAGHILAAAGDMEKLGDGVTTSTQLQYARLYAGIGELDAGDLFLPEIDEDEVQYSYDADPGVPGHITKEHAVRCLRKFIDTGVVDWTGTAPKGGENE